MKLKGNINHAVCRWCYSKINIEQLCIAVKRIGIKGIDLLSPHEWQFTAKHGLECSISNGSSLGITKGFNDNSYHEQLWRDYESLLPKAADAGITQVICFSGNRNGMDNEAGMENCAQGLKPVLRLAEQLGVTLVMELLNSKVDHSDYMCDHTAWGAALCEKVGSPNFKLLYDIYHMQIMEGDVIATIRKYHPYISHYHTGGVPGRNEIDEQQELHYPAIMRAILETGFKGYVAQEFIPSRGDDLKSLTEAVKVCDV